jgi:hypothetical protein
MSFKLEYISEVEAKGQTDRIENREVQKLLQKSDLEEVYRKAPSLVLVLLEHLTAVVESAKCTNQ